MKSDAVASNLRRWIPGLLISALAIFIIIRLVSWEELDTAFSTIRLIYLLPGTVLVVAWLFLRSVALKVILGGKPSVWQTFRAINIGYLINNIFPLRAGEIAKAVVLGKSTRLGASYVLSAIVIERAFDLLYAAGFLLIALPYVLEMDWTRPVAVIVLIIVLGGMFALYLAARNHDWIRARMEKLGERAGFIRKYVQPQMDSFLQGLQILTDIKRFFLCVLMMGLSWMLAIFLYYVMLFAIAPAPELWWGVFVNSILAMGIALPSAPAALGVFEASMVAGLKVVGISYSFALAYAVVMHFLQFVVTGVLGFASLAKEKQSISGLLQFTGKQKTAVKDADMTSEGTK